MPRRGAVPGTLGELRGGGRGPDTGLGTRGSTVLAGAMGTCLPQRSRCPSELDPLPAARGWGGQTRTPPRVPVVRALQSLRDRHPPATQPRRGGSRRPARPSPQGWRRPPAPPALTHRRPEAPAAATPGPGATAAWRRPLPCRAASSRGAGPPRRPPGSAPRRRARPPPGPALHPAARRRLLPPPLPAAPGAGEAEGGGGPNCPPGAQTERPGHRGGAQPVICT